MHLEYVRCVGIGIHKQDIRVPVEQVVHEAKEKSFCRRALAAADIEYAVLNVHAQSSVSGMSGV